MITDKIITIPNILSTLRILLVPIFVISMNIRDYSLALKILILAGITDSVDGIIARKFNQTSKLGIFLDPFADKLLLISIMITFYLHQLVPRWFILLLLTRDILIALGWLEIYLRKKKLMNPHILGKLFNASVVIVFIYVLFALNFNLSKPSPFIYLLVASIAVVSLIQYLIQRLSRDK